MKILLSPAKKLNFNCESLPSAKLTRPVFEEQAAGINRILKALNPSELSALMHISNALAELNWKRNQEWTDSADECPALFAFDGNVYKSLDVKSLNDRAKDYLQSNLRIISGLYGILRPYDLIKPYRLEMGTSLAVGEAKNLYAFWKQNLTDYLWDETGGEEYIVNLASAEYAKAVDLHRFAGKVITPVFKDYHKGAYKVIGIYAKNARGKMLRYMAENKVEDPEDLKNFHDSGYLYDETLSDASRWVFTRDPSISSE